MNQRGILLETPGAWGAPLHWPLRDGERKLLTVGSNADWSIADGGLLPVHATLYFDGVNLCVAAAPGATLNGEPLGADWSPVPLPAQLSLGQTKITIAPSESEATFHTAPSELEALSQKTTIMGFADLAEFREVSRIARAGGRNPGLGGEPAEADRVTPTGAFLSPFFDPNATAYGHAPSAPAPSRAPTSAALPLPSPPSIAPLTDAAPMSVRSALVRSFQDASWPKRLSVILLPLVIGLFGVGALRARKDRTLAIPAASASAAQSVPSERAAASPLPVPTVTPVPPVRSGDTGAAGGTLQRRAVDAFASGNFRDAALLYQRLAAENPREAAFAAAARIALEKANGAGHD